MKKRMLILFLFIIITLSACASSEGDDTCFVVIAHRGCGDIIYDKKTGVEYWMVTSGFNKGNLTLLVDEDGKPLIYEGE